MMQNSKQSANDLSSEINEVGLGDRLSNEHLSTGKKKGSKRIVIIIILLIIGAIVFLSFFNNAGANKYEFVKVAKKDLRETVEITGNVEAGATINLTFRQAGQVAKIFFEAGDKLRKDDIIASLRNTDEQLRLKQAKANLSGAQANLNQKLAGSSNEEIKIAESGVYQAQASAEKINIDNENAKIELELIKQKYIEDEKQAQLLVDDTKSKYDYALKNQSNTGKTQDQNVETAKQDLEAQLFSTATQIQQSLVDLKSVVINDGNSALGTDFQRLDSNKVNQAQTYYYQAKSIFDTLYLTLKSTSGYETEKLKEFSVQEQNLVGNLLQAQKLTTDALSILASSSTISPEQITSLKNKIFADSNTLSASLSGLNLKYQNILTAILNISTNGDTSLSNADAAKNLYNRQLQSFTQTKIDHQVDLNSRLANIKSSQAQYQVQLAAVESAKATLQLKKVPPRAVDVAFLRTAVLADQVSVSLAEENLEKTLLRAPIEGVLSRRNIELAEDTVSASSSAGKALFEMISNAKYKINANISEVDINKIKIGDQAEITFDAVGDATKFSGTISKINPVETKIQDVVFYQVEVVVQTADVRIRPGMTATVDIVLKESKNALYVPEKAVQNDNGKRYVRVLEGEKIKNIDVEIGLRDLQGDLEIKNGLKEGQEIILRTVK